MYRNLVFVGSSHLEQFKIRDNQSLFHKNKYMVHTMIGKGGATIRGLVNENSTTGVNTYIREVDLKDKIIIFHLGQVDIEFGYYYKSVLANYKLDKSLFIKEIISRYETFLQTIDGIKVIIGVNPTVIRDNRHIFHQNFKNGDYKLLLNEEMTHYIENLEFEHCSHIYNDSTEELNSFLKTLNDELKSMCKKYAYVFCNMWDILASSSDTILDEYRGEGHHIMPSTKLTEYLITTLNANL